MSTGTATTFILGGGSTLALAATSNGTLVPVTALKSITYSGTKSDYADITNLGSPAYETGGPPSKEYAPSVITPGTSSVTGILAPAGDPGQTAVSAAFATQQLQYFTHQFAPAAGQSTGAKRVFAGYVSSKPAMNAQLTDAVSFDFEIQITGVITDTPGVATQGS
jgi:hypothetical protein